MTKYKKPLCFIFYFADKQLLTLLSIVNFEKTWDLISPKREMGLYICASPRGKQRPRFPQGDAGYPLRFSAVPDSLLVRSRFGVSSVVLRSLFGPIESEETPNKHRRTTEQRAHEE